jgi:predicted permease
VVLSYGYWQRKFGGDAHVIGRVVLIDFVPHQVIGVMPRTFQFLDFTPDLLLPQEVLNGPIDGDEFNHSGIARLKPDVTVNQANQDIRRVLTTWGDTGGDIRQMIEQLRLEPDLRPLKQDVVGDVGTVLNILMGALALMLLLVCVNVANLVQVRAQARRQEFAIRAALGAGCGRIVRELLVESATLGILGGTLGLGLAYVGLQLLVSHGSVSLPRLDEISIDSTSIFFGLACSLASSVLFGLTAILNSVRNSGLQNTRGASPTKEHIRTQHALVTVQVALALVLLIAAGLMVRTAHALGAVTPGFIQPAQIQTVRILIPEAQTPAPERVLQTQVDILQRLAAIPGVTAVAYADGLPMEFENHNGNPIAVEGRAPIDGIPPNRTMKRVSPGLFKTLGTRLIAGRDFTWDDVFGRRRVGIVSENMARENWGEPHNALGKRIRNGDAEPWTEIVGVVENVHDDGVDQPPPATVYWRAGLSAPLRPGEPAVVRRAVTFAIRSDRAGTESFRREITAGIHAVNANLPLAKVRTLNDVYRLSIARRSFALVLLAIAGALALALAIVGVYGVLAYTVSHRSRELSIRVAVGAEPGMVKLLFVRQGLLLACVGGVIGMSLAVALSHWISSLLFGVTPLDPGTYAASGVIILMAVVTASYIPACRAASADPMETLRSD